MNTSKSTATMNSRGRTTTKAVKQTAKSVKSRESTAQLAKPNATNQKGVWFKKNKLAQQVTSPMTTVRFTSENTKVCEKVEEKPRLTALEELFPKHVLEEIRTNSEVSGKLEEEDSRFYKLLVQSLYVSDQITDPQPEQMTSEQLEKLIEKTQKDMAEVEEKVQVKERQRARLLRWWEVKHDMLTYLFKCKSEREGKPDLYIEHMTQSQC